MKFKARFAAGIACLGLFLCPEASDAADWGVRLTVDKSSPQAIASVGTVAVNATAYGSGYSGEQYQFWLYSSKSAKFTMVRDYGPSPSWAWTPDAVDYYLVQVRARNGGSTAAFEKSSALSYYVLAEAPVSALSLSVDKAPPQPAAAMGTVTFTAAAVGGGSGGVEYQFWLYSTAARAYRVVKDYPAAGNSWTPGAGDMDNADSYVVRVYARSAGSAMPYEKAAVMPYAVAAEAPVSALTLSADKVSPQLVGTPVTFTATAVGGGSSGVEYQFWLYSTASAAYRLVKAYDVPGGAWTPGAGDMDAADAYVVKAYARSKGSTVAYEKSATRSFTMAAQQPVTAVTLVADKTSPLPVVSIGTVTFTAAAVGGGSSGVEYQFWLYSTIGKAYLLVKDYPAAENFWTPGAGDMDAADTYVVRVYARNKGSALPYEKSASLAFSVIAEPPVSAVALGGDKPSPQPAGQPLTFTATAEGGGSGGVEYQFWLSSGEGGEFVPVGDATTGYSPANSWHWAPLAADTYQVMVYARSVGNVAPFEKRVTLPFTIDPGVTTCEGCHSGAFALAPNVMGDGTLANGDPAHGSPKPYDDGSYGFNVNGHGRDADTNNMSHGNAINAACVACHDIAVPAGTHLDGVLDGRTPTASNANPFHLVSGYIDAAPANEWSVQVKFDDYCYNACHKAKYVPDDRHLSKVDPLPNYVEMGTHGSYPQPMNSPPPEMFYDVNITWLDGFNGPPNFALCVSCHNPHGTNVVSPNLVTHNNRMMIYRWEAPATLCSRCHI